MIIGALDTETTGLEWGDHRFVEVYVEQIEYPTRKSLTKKLQRINPQRSIQPAAQAVHKISLSDLVGCPAWEDVAKNLHALLSGCDLLVAHNGQGFDLPFLNYEFKRAGLSELRVPMFDTMLEGRWATPIGKVPNLGELCWACEVDYDGSKAHAADYDVGVMIECFFRGLDWGFFRAPLPHALAEAA